ncbi:101 kDa malaria antigen-like [Homarus americanus]|uniref:Uncharacterized protein n=1 Tax=Homarus americanus TaxID=6706 RepID=A0A8J5JB98_HOMAM|nr:101 kDa malaria antigen-like [Homarus americanus]KAG7155462.1 hypothetical protein Hamer_G022609 [Homarus americanus]
MKFALAVMVMLAMVGVNYAFSSQDLSSRNQQMDEVDEEDSYTSVHQRVRRQDEDYEDDSDESSDEDSSDSESSSESESESDEK